MELGPPNPFQGKILTPYVRQLDVLAYSVCNRVSGDGHYWNHTFQEPSLLQGENGRRVCGSLT